MNKVSDERLKKAIDTYTAFIDGVKADGEYDDLDPDMLVAYQSMIELQSLRKQNKELLEDGERLAEFANGLGIIKAGDENWICAFCNGEENSHTSDCEFGCLIEQHKELKERIEKKV